MTNLTLKDALEILGAPDMGGDQRQLERLRKWLERLVEAHGEDYVRKNRPELLSQWEQHAKSQFKSCV